MTAVEFIVQEINKLTGLTISMDEPCVVQAKVMEEQAKVEFAFIAFSDMIRTGESFVDVVNSMRTK